LSQTLIYLFLKSCIPIEERKPGYKREKDGGIGCYNKEEIKSQEGLVF
jgi:hypothetical protein